jgi:hypothetical protein
MLNATWFRSSLIVIYEIIYLFLSLSRAGSLAIKLRASFFWVMKKFSLPATLPALPRVIIFSLHHTRYKWI